MEVDDIERWVRKLRNSHKASVLKLDLPGKKFFLPSKNDCEEETVDNNLKAIAGVLDSDRAERRCARSVGLWLNDKKLAELTRIVGDLKNFGFANKEGRFLYPEEVLFLLEINRLELLWNNVPVSIRQAYQVILGSPAQFLKYVIYRKLASSGFRITHAKSKESVEEPPSKKPHIEEGLQNVASEDEHSQAASSDSNKLFYENIFERLRMNGPKQYQTTTTQRSDYHLYASSNTKRNSVDFNVCIFQGENFEPRLSINDGSSVVGYSNSQFVGFFSITKVILPNLI